MIPFIRKNQYAGLFLLFHLAAPLLSFPQFEIIVLDSKSNQAIPDPKAVFLWDPEIKGNSLGRITIPAVINVIENNKTVKKETSPYFKVTAAGYKEQNVNLSNYSPGSIVTIKLSSLAPETLDLHVYVKDKSNKAVKNAVIAPRPGISGVTNSSGFTVVKMKALPGDYVTVLITADGFLQQEIKVMAGEAQRNSQSPFRRIPDRLNVVLEKGENEYGVDKLVVEVLDDESKKPVAGALVKLKFSFGDEVSNYTDSKGEALFIDIGGDKQTSARAIVTHKDYKEKWSDITSDLMTAKATTQRQFLVILTPKATWAGTWVYANDASRVMVLNGQGTAVTGSYTYGGVWKSKSIITGCRDEGTSGTNKIICNWTDNYEDAEKFIKSSGTIEMTMEKNSISGFWKEVGEPSIRWKNNIKPYKLTDYQDGKIWNFVLRRK